MQYLFVFFVSSSHFSFDACANGREQMEKGGGFEVNLGSSPISVHLNRCCLFLCCQSLFVILKSNSLEKSHASINQPCPCFVYVL